MVYKILLVDDQIKDKNYSLFKLPALMQAAGYEVLATADGETAYDLVWEYHPDLILVDINLGIPGYNGIDFCVAIRSNGSRIPIILITAYMIETEDVLRGFEAGADDYVTWPRDLREVLARVRANLPPETVTIDDNIRIDFRAQQVWVNKSGNWQVVQLQPLQFDLLQLLVNNAGLIMPTTTLKERVWGKVVSDGVLAVYIRHLREKLEPQPSDPIHIETKKGIGYRFNGRPVRGSFHNYLTPERPDD